MIYNVVKVKKGGENLKEKNDNIQISLAAARVNAKLTQDQVASRLKVRKQTIVNWEKGVTTPKVEQARALSELYNFPLKNIFFA